ncbi:MAG: LysR family transcriptional regulator [Alphaproteobacteria bacterium]|nr:LysR family transcriptional regulator [Alphaproteobacteria bacterium]
MEMHQVRYFLAVCRTLNFTKAAEECNVAQPSLTRAIQKLEEEFGGLLFHRERANTHLTELGRAMLPHLERTFEAAQTAKQLATGFKKGEIAHLRLGVANSVSSHLLAGVLKGVRDGVPNFELTMDAACQSDLVDEAVEGDLDLVVLGNDKNLPERLRSWTLFRENVWLIMPATHELAALSPVPLTSLDGRDFVERAQCGSSERLREIASEIGITLNFRHRATSEEQLQNLVQAGFGLGLVPQTITLQQGLIARQIDGAELQRSVGLGAVAGRRFSVASDAFVKLARTRDWSAAIKS